MKTQHQRIVSVLVPLLVLVGCGPSEPPARRTTPPPAARTTPPPVRNRPPHQAPLTAAQVVDKAIQAAGGLAALKAKLSAFQAETKGTYLGMPYRASLSTKLPGHYFTRLHGLKMEWAMDGASCWRRTRGIVQDCAPAQQQEMQEMNAVNEFMLLYPLKAPGVTLKRIQSPGAAQATTCDILVTRGNVQATLRFDRKTFRLTRLSWTGAFGPTHQRGQLVVELSDYHTHAGVAFPGHSTMRFEGKPVMSETVLSVKPGHVDESVFKRPAQLAFGAPQDQPTPAYQAAWTRLSAKNKDLAKKVPEAVKALYAWIHKQGLKPLPAAPVLHFLRLNRRRSRLEIRVGVLKPAQPVAKAKNMGVKAIPAQKRVWALQQGSYAQVAKHLKALKRTLRKQRRRVVGKGGMQPVSDPRKVTDPAKRLYVVFFDVRK